MCGPRAMGVGSSASATELEITRASTTAPSASGARIPHFFTLYPLLSVDRLRPQESYCFTKRRRESTTKARPGDAADPGPRADEDLAAVVVEVRQAVALDPARVAQDGVDVEGRGVVGVEGAPVAARRAGRVQVVGGAEDRV